MVVKLLSFGSEIPKHCPSGQSQVDPLLVILPVDQEVFLLGPDRDRNMLGGGVTI